MARRQARRSSGGGGGVLWFGSGMLCGLGLATVIWMMGLVPGARDADVSAPLGHDEPPIAELDAPARSRSYEFFTVLPEIEVVVPNREIEQRAREAAAAPADAPAQAASGGPYLLQVGSFRSNEDAEGLRAQLTLLGVTARIQTVTVDNATWHRVRVGPFDDARAADEARRRLQANGLESMVLSGGG